MDWGSSLHFIRLCVGAKERITCKPRSTVRYRRRPCRPCRFQQVKPTHRSLRQLCRFPIPIKTRESIRRATGLYWKLDSQSEQISNVLVYIRDVLWCRASLVRLRRLVLPLFGTGTRGALRAGGGEFRQVPTGLRRNKKKILRLIRK